MKAKSMRFHSTLALCLAVFPAMSWAQSKPASDNPFLSGPSTLTKPWTKFKLSKTKHVKLNFKNAGVDSVLQFFMDQTGVTIIHDPTFKDPLTLASATPVTLDRALDILSATIALKGFRIESQDGMLVIKARQQDQPRPIGDVFPNPGGTQSDQSILTTYPIKYANASEVARVVNDIFAAGP